MKILDPDARLFGFRLMSRHDAVTREDSDSRRKGLFQVPATDLGRLAM